MNAGFRYFCFVCASLLATQVFAQDMSGWSDKTVCRLLAQSPDNAEYIDESTKRQLQCELPVSKPIPKTTSEDPLDSLTIPDNWTPIVNRKIYDDERRASSFVMRVAHQSPYDKPICYDVLYDFDNSIQSEVNGTSNESGWGVRNCSTKLRTYHALMGNTPSEYRRLMLHWAKVEELSLPTNKSDRYYQRRTYMKTHVLGTWGSYYALHYDEFKFTDAERELVDTYWVKQLKTADTRNSVRTGEKICNQYSLKTAARELDSGKAASNSCGSILWSIMQGQLLLGLKLNDEELFKKGISNVKWQMRFFDEDGIFVPYASGRGASALGYMHSVPAVLGILTEVFATLDYDFLSYKINANITVKEVLDGQFKIYKNHLLLLPYNGKMKHAYGGTDLMMSDYRRYTSAQALRIYGYSFTEFVHAVPRYIDLYRPDLYHYKIESTVLRGENGNGINTLSGLNMIDPYMMYIANTAEPVVTMTTSSDQLPKHIASDGDDKRPKNDRLDSDFKKPLPVVKRLPNDYTFDESDEVISRDPTQCNFNVQRHISDGEENHVIATGKVVLRDGLLNFSDENWSTGSASQQQQLLENHANLKVMKQTGITGIAPLYAMFIGDNETPQRAVYVRFGSGANKSEVELEGAHYTFYRQKSIGFTLSLSGCELI